MKKVGNSLAREYYQWLVLVQVSFDLEMSTVVKLIWGTTTSPTWGSVLPMNKAHKSVYKCSDLCFAMIGRANLQGNHCSNSACGLSHGSNQFFFSTLWRMEFLKRITYTPPAPLSFKPYPTPCQYPISTPPPKHLPYYSRTTTRFYCVLS